MAEQLNRPPRLIRVFVSSPGDVADERQIAKRVLERLAAELATRVDLQSTFWEHQPMLAHAPFPDSIERPSQFDIVICILWKRLGTPLPEKYRGPDNRTYDSGTEFELEDALAGRQQREQTGIDPPWPDILVYRKTAEPVIHVRDRLAAQEEFEQLRLLDGFAERFFEGAGAVLVKAFNPFANAGEFEARMEDHLRELIERRLKSSAPDDHLPVAPARATWKGCPFLGFKVFEFEHRDIFFGRTREVSEVLDALRKQAADGCPFLLVVGESGCGKSSLVRAGVLPMLVQPNVIEGVTLVRRVLFRKSDRLGATQGDLFDALAAALVRGADALQELTLDGSTTSDLAAQLRANPGRASALVKGALALAADRRQREQSLPEQPQARLVLVVDQLEELFTADDLNAEQRANFFAAVRDLVSGGQTLVLATLRSDFFHRCAEIPALSELKSTSGQYHLQPPDAAGIAQLIRRPAFAAGLRYEEDLRTGQRLDDLLLTDAAENRDSLPLLEFLLEELYERRKENELTLEAYEALGRINGVVARRAEEVFHDARYTDAVRAALPFVLRHLVTLSADDGAVPARKQAPLAAFDESGSASSSGLPSPGCQAGDSPTKPAAITPARQLVDALVSARLLTAKEIDDRTQVVEITHEKLLTSWGRVGDGLKLDLELLRIHQRIATVATNWHGSGRSAALLLQPSKPLEEGRQLLADGFPISPVELELIAQSQSSARSRARFRRAAVATHVVLTVLAVGGAWRATVERSRAEEAESRAVQSRNEAEANAKLAEEERDTTFKTLEMLADSHDSMGREKARHGDKAAAEASYGLARAIRFSLASADPRYVLSPRDLSFSLDIKGDASETQDNLVEAREFYSKGLEIRQQLAKDNPKSDETQNDLSVSYKKLGSVCRRQGDLAAARKFYSLDLEIAYSRTFSSKPASFHSATLQDQRDLWATYDINGDLSIALGDLDAARKFYEGAVTMGERLVRFFPQVDLLQHYDLQKCELHHDLADAYCKLGGTLAEEDKLSEAITQYRKAISVLRKLAAAAPDERAVPFDPPVLTGIDGTQYAWRRQELEWEAENIEDLIADYQVQRVAGGDWKTLLREPAAELPAILYRLSSSLTEAGRVADAEQVAAKLQELEPKTADNLYYAARGYALCAQALGTPPPTDEKTAEQHEDITLALACLKEAIAAGYSDFEYLRIDSGFLSLRELPEFLALFPAEKKQPHAETPLKNDAGGSEK